MRSEPPWESWRVWAALGSVESRYGKSGHGLCLVPSLELDWRKHANCRVTALAVVEDLEILEDRVRQLRRSMSSTCIRLQNDSIMALSKQLPTDPIEGRRPESSARLVNAHEVNWVP